MTVDRFSKDIRANIKRNVSSSNIAYASKYASLWIENKKKECVKTELEHERKKEIVRS